MNKRLEPTAHKGLVDCHCHLLPDIDDGAIDTEMMIAMAKVAVKAGTKSIIVTPHHGNGVFSNSKKQVFSVLSEIQKILKKSKIDLQLYPGSELHLTPELITELKQNTVLTYADQGKAVLIELPKQNIPIGTEMILNQIIEMGITPVIAHPERNGELLQSPTKYEQWVGWGCKGQLTGMSVDGRFGKLIQKVSNRWLQGGYIHFVASDAHRPKGRNPDLAITYEYVQHRYGSSVAKCLMHTNPNNLITGSEIKTCRIENTDNEVFRTKSISFMCSRLFEYFKNK